MIVINKSITLTHLPYDNGVRKCVFSFQPGKNEIEDEIFDAVKAEIGEHAWDAYYGDFLTPVGVDLSAIAHSDAVKLINGTFDPAKLKEYQTAEEAGKNRQAILAAIEKQVTAVGEIDKKKVIAS